MKQKLLCLLIWTVFIGITKSVPCINDKGNAMMCFDQYSNSIAKDKIISASNTCGMKRTQKYCIRMSSRQKVKRCEYCDKNYRGLHHPASYLIDGNKETWWQSETMAANSRIGKTESVNITLDLGGLYHVNYVFLIFKSPLPNAIIIHKKYKETSEWTPWGYFSSNCQAYFGMESLRDLNYKRIKYGSDFVKLMKSKPICSEAYSIKDGNSNILFSVFNDHNKADQFFSDPEIMKWATAYQIRIELKKMARNDYANEKEILLTQYFAMSTIQVAARCWCNGHGNKCMQSTGVNQKPKMHCLCSHNTAGRLCDMCRDFYQDVPWKPATLSNANPCKKCNCNGNSNKCIFDMATYIKSGNKSGGVCIQCSGKTTGKNCEQCKNGFFKSKLKYFVPTTKVDGKPQFKKWTCLPCNCDPIGSMSDSCDDQGNCNCRAGVTGKKCTRCERQHYGFGRNGCINCNCYAGGTSLRDKEGCNSLTGACHCKDNVNGVKCDKCLDGYFSLRANDPLGCQPCFCFAHTRQCKGAKDYSIATIGSTFEKDVDNWYYLNEKGEKLTPYIDSTISGISGITWFKGRDDFNDNIFLYAPKKFLGNQRTSYNLKLYLYLSFRGVGNGKYQTGKMRTITPDVEIMSDSLAVSVPFDVLDENPAPYKGNKIPIRYQFLLNEKSGGWRGKLDHYRFNAILSNLTAIRIRITNPDGYILVHRVILEKAIIKSEQKKFNKYSPAFNMENCTCSAAYTGLSCENCADGYYRQTAHGTPFVKCIRCTCNNQADTCDKLTGKCICKYNTIGDNCETCKVGFYGDPTTKKRNICKPCGCPFDTSCVFKDSQVICTNCPNHMSGPKCNRCESGYYGDPLNGVKCKKCNCHGNIGYLDKCDQKTGKCSNCLFNSFGDYCEFCRPGYYQNPKERGIKRCKKCNCNENGTLSTSYKCNMFNGKCPCKPKVTGQNCDVCQEGFYNFKSSKPCKPCECSPFGSYNKSCNDATGQCNCRPGLTGRTCNSCKPNFYNFEVNIGCKPCNCNPIGSKQLQCDADTGKCECKLNVVGQKCDKCKENFHDFKSGCKECPGCYALVQLKLNQFNQNFNKIFKNNTNTTEVSLDTTAIQDSLVPLKKMYLLFMNYLNRSDPISPSDMFEMTLADIKVLLNSSAIDVANETLAKRQTQLINLLVESTTLIRQAKEAIEKLKATNKPGSNKLHENYRKLFPIDYYSQYEEKYSDFINFMKELKALTNTTKFVETIGKRDMLLSLYNMSASQELRFSDDQLLEIFRDMSQFKEKFKKWNNEFLDLNKQQKKYEEFYKAIFDTTRTEVIAEVKPQFDKYEKEIDLCQNMTDGLQADVRNYSESNNLVKYSGLYHSLLKYNKYIQNYTTESEEKLRLLEKINADVNISKVKAILKTLNLDELKSQYEDLKSKVDQNQLHNNKTAAELQIIISKYDEINAKMDKASEKLNNLKILVTDLENKSRTLNDKLKSDETKLKDAKEKALKNEKQISEEIKESDRIQKKIDAEFKNLASIKNDTAEYIDEDMEKYKNEYEELNKLVNSQELLVQQQKKNLGMFKRQYELFSEDVNRLNNIERQLVGLKACWKTGGSIEGG